MRQQALYWPDSLTWMITKQKEYCIAGSAVITAITLNVELYFSEKLINISYGIV